MLASGRNDMTIQDLGCVGPDQMPTLFRTATTGRLRKLEHISAGTSLDDIWVSERRKEDLLYKWKIDLLRSTRNKWFAVPATYHFAGGSSHYFDC